MLEKVLDNPMLKAAARRLTPGATVGVGGVWGSSSALAAAAMGRLAGRTVLYIASHLDDADDVADDYEVFTGTPAELLPAWEVDLGADHLNDEVAGERIRVCLALDNAAAGQAAPRFIVAPVMALLQPVPTRQALAAAKLSLRKGMQLGPEQLAAWLTDAGFEHVEQVDQQGEFARRGGIVDVLPPGVGQAVRVEFFGDEIDSIRRFDLDTQRSSEQLPAFDITGFTAAQAAQAGQLTSLLSYLPPGAIVAMDEPEEVMELAGELYRRMKAQATADDDDGASPASPPTAKRPPRFDAERDRWVDDQDEDEALADAHWEEPTRRRPALLSHVHDPSELMLGLKDFALLELRALVGRDDTCNLGIRSLQRLSVNTHEALEELTELARVAEVWVYCENPAEQRRFGELLAAQHPALASSLHTAIGHVKGGFYWPAQRLVAVGHHEVFQRYTKVRRIRRVRAGRPIESLLDLREGDYVVHVAHGIAKFEGLRTLQRDGRGEEYLRLVFADNAVLHVPVASINLVQKYVGSRGKRPTLSKLGGSGWLKAKQRVEMAVTDLAAELLRVQAARAASPGVSYPLGTDWQRQFEEEFLYEETEDQLTAMRQIDDDMFRPRPMDRLLCGDVGYGKTELAMRAAFKVAEAGKQVAVLVPTTVLADQHYRTFRERFADYPMTVEVLSRFRKGADVKRVLGDLAGGRVNVLIGTHRMLSKDVQFADLGLAVIDEEQRFGVEHKERLKALRATVDVLTMTATPIPRTLHMSLLGLRDISSLTTPPLDRRSIHTEVRHYDDDFIRAAIERELNRQGQVFFVHNRVMDIDSLAQHIHKLVPDARVDVGHGQMSEGALEKTMLRFTNRRTDVLVCTTIIESGLDIPTANTIIIHNADRFGLAELHQLRGRVGRYKHRAYCYLLLPQERPVSSVAAKRLKAIEEFSDLGAGFQIAMRDLEIRGAGNILGPEQSGHIAAVGYELYCQILEKAVRQMRNEPAPVHHDVHVEIGVDALIPRSFVPSERQRMEIYRRLARCAAAEELRRLHDDMVDAYGPIPPAVQTLLDVAEIRVRCGVLGIDSIIKMEPDIIFGVRDFGLARKALDGLKGTVRLPDSSTAHWRPPAAYLEPPTLIRVLLQKLRAAAPAA